MTADAIDLYQAVTARAQQAVQGVVLRSAYQIDMRGETHQIEMTPNQQGGMTCFGMLSLASLQSFLWPPALFPMTLLRAVVEAVVSGVAAFMAVVSTVGLAAPTSEAAPCVVGDTLTCPVPLQVDR